MTIVVGFVSTKEGRAALSRAVEEARLRQSKLVAINSNRGGRGSDEAPNTQAAVPFTTTTPPLSAYG